MRNPIRLFAPRALAVALALAALVGAGAATAAPSAGPGEIPQPRRPSAVRVPAEIGAWRLAGEAQHFDEHGIFDYMDGAGEIYVSYRFAGLDVFEYSKEGEDPIVVEVYRMRSPDDAFGLLSLDWTGAPDSAFAYADSLPRTVAFEGTVRVWADDLFVRIISYHSTPASDEASREIARRMLDGKKSPPPPALVQSALTRDTIHLKPGTLRFFRTHTILNSVFYVHPENVLELDRSDDALAGEFEEGGAVVLVLYADAGTAARALARLRTEVLGESASEPLAAGTVAGVGPFGEIRCAYRLEGRSLALVFSDAEESGIMARLERAFKTVARVAG